MGTAKYFIGFSIENHKKKFLVLVLFFSKIIHQFGCNGYVVDVGDEFFEAEGFLDVVMDVRLKSSHLVRVCSSACGDNGDDDVFIVSTFNDFSEGCPAVHERHHEIHEDDAFEASFEFFDAVVATVYGQDFEILVFEEYSKEDQQVRVIIHNHDFLAHFFHLTSCVTCYTLSILIFILTSSNYWNEKMS